MWENFEEITKNNKFVTRQFLWALNIILSLSYMRIVVINILCFSNEISETICPSCSFSSVNNECRRFAYANVCAVHSNATHSFHVGLHFICIWKVFVVHMNLVIGFIWIDNVTFVALVLLLRYVYGVGMILWMMLLLLLLNMLLYLMGML